MTELKDTWVCPPSPGFESLPPLADIPLIEIPNPDKAQSVLMPVGTMNMVFYKNEITGNLKYEYETQYLEPLYPESPDHGQKSPSYESSSK